MPAAVWLHADVQLSRPGVCLSQGTEGSSSVVPVISHTPPHAPTPRPQEGTPTPGAAPTWLSELEHLPNEAPQGDSAWPSAHTFPSVLL